MISIQDEEIWQHWNIEKNLISVDGETLDYDYVPPSNFILWPLLTGGMVIVGVAVVILIRGKKPKKK